MSEYLWRKTRAYERALTQALAVATADGEDGQQCLEMAEAYLADGRHFLSRPDLPNALAAFAYGHGWLDAGVRLGVLEVSDADHFTI